jgi:mannosyltransferase OCH1-like enzyme
MPQLAKDCILSWHKYMPDWEYRLWNEDNFDVNSVPYTKEAYQAGKYAFVSDYVRLKALYDEGGLYLDVDFEVYKPFDDLMSHKAFAGVEGSKHHPVMMGVCASEAHGEWINEMLDAYQGKHFLVDGKPDMTPNVTLLTAVMRQNGLVQNGLEQDYKDLHIFPVDYFSPHQTTGEYVRTENTYCEHRGLASWSNTGNGWTKAIFRIVGQRNMTCLIKLKRKLIG